MTARRERRADEGGAPDSGSAASGAREAATVGRATALVPEWRARAMAALAVLHLAMTSLLIPHPGFTVDIGAAISGAPGFPWVFAAVWAAVAAEALWSLRRPLDGFAAAARRCLLVCAAPPLRAMVCPAVPGSVAWLPGGWRRADEALFTAAEARAAFPMLMVALLVLPVVGAEFLLEERIAAEPAVAAALHTLNAVIWFAFTLELVVLLALAPDRKRFLIGHWINVLIVALPFLGFLRGVRLVAAVSAPNIAALAQSARFRVLLVRTMRVVVFLKLIERFVHRDPRVSLARLRDKRDEKARELAKLEAEIAAAKEALARKESAAP